MRDDDADVVIVGAGIAGLGLACALARWDVRVLLLERRHGAGGIHRGDSLLPRTTALFRAWGVLEAIKAGGAEPIDRIELHHRRWGKLYERALVAPGSPDPYLVLPHARTEEVLLEQALAFGRTTLVRPGKAVDLVVEGGRVRGVVYEANGERRTARARLVVGADGHRSIVREKLGIGASVLKYDHAYLGLEADRPATYENAMRLHLHEEGGVLLMPRPTRVGIGMLVEPQSGKQWIGMSDDELRARIVARAPILESVAIHKQAGHVYELARAHAHGYQRAGAVLIGDAIHATNPAAGQGMTMALGDAEHLSTLVGPALERGGDPGAAVVRYEAERRPRNAGMLRGSHWLALAYSRRGRSWDRLKTGAIRALAGPVGKRLVEPIIATFLEPERPNTKAPPPVPVVKRTEELVAVAR